MGFVKSGNTLVLALMALAAPVSLAAQQEEAAAKCDIAAAPQSAREFCRLVVQGIETAQPRIGLAMTGGNPVPGTASTLGMRLGAMPRISVDGRATAVYLELPPIRNAGGQDNIKAAAPAIAVDAAVGLFSGFSPAPTVGGVGSLDVLGGFSVVPVPEGEGFSGSSPTSWAVGARLGLLRESFVTPGISVSAMYRKTNDIVFGDSTLVDEDAFFSANLDVLSLRAAISKRLLFLGATAGVGYDKYSSDIAVRARASGYSTPMIRMDGFDTDRKMAFANLSWTMLVLNLVGEVGYQTGGEVIPGTPSNVNFDAEKGALFGSLAVRVSI